MQNYHIIKVANVSPTSNNYVSRVRIESERFKQRLMIPYTNEPGSRNPSVESAETYLKSKGFVIIGQGEGKDHYYLISTTFEPIK